MQFQEFSFPHPVLGVRDDILENQESSAALKVDFNYKKHIETKFLFNLKNQEIRQLINKKSAVFAVEIDCKKTFLRTCVTSTKPKIIHLLKKSDVKDKVEVNFLVLANQTINDYKNPQAHPDYRNSSFFLERGDVLAYLGKNEFFAEKNWRELKAVESFMEVQKGDHEEGGFYVDLNYRKIVIKLSKKEFELYRSNRLLNYKHFENLFHSAIALPSLAYAINALSRDRSNYEDKIWAQVLIKRAKEDDNIGMDMLNEPEKALNMAQIILEEPACRSFQSMHKIIDEREELDR